MMSPINNPKLKTFNFKKSKLEDLLHLLRFDPLSPACATVLQDALPFCNSIVHQLIALESCSNHLWILQVFYFRFFFIFSFGCGVSCG